MQGRQKVKTRVASFLVSLEDYESQLLLDGRTMHRCSSELRVQDNLER